MTTSTSSEQLDPRAQYEALVWQATAQIDLGTLIEKYLTEHPAPVGATDHHRYHVCAADLRAAGEADLARVESAC